MNRYKINFLLIVLSILTVVSCSGPSKSGEEAKSMEVNIYTQRHYDADKKAFEMFTEKTGIKINVVKAGADELINKLELEGDASPADLFFTVDAGKLYRAKEKGLLQKLDAALSADVPDNLRDEDGFWQGVTYRARVIAYSKDVVTPDQLSTYEDLADPRWNGKIAIRSSSSAYNQSLLASIINATDEETAKSWAAGIVANMAREPQGGDRDQIKAMASGVGEVSIVNTYYVGLLLNSSNPEEVKAGESVGIFFPNQEGRGTHVNVSGIGITKNAPNKENAIKLIEFLLSEEVQSFFANNSYEYPANSKVAPAETVAAWGDFKKDNLLFSKVAEHNNTAVKIFDEVGWK